MLQYFGPALIVSVAYMDPGNFGTDISGGAQFGYSMLWIVWFAEIMAMLLQYLSGKLGIATGHSLPELMRLLLKSNRYIIPYWLGAEVAAAMTDLAEFLGTVIALNLLFGIPLIYGTFLAVFDVLLILGVTKGSVRRLEQLYAGSITPDLSSTPKLLCGRSNWRHSYAARSVRAFGSCKR